MMFPYHVEQQIKKQPELVNNDPYNEGWMVKMEVNDPSEVEKLMSAEDYSQMVG